MSCPFGYGSASKTAAAHKKSGKFSVLGFDTKAAKDDTVEFTNTKRDETLCNYTDYIQTDALLKLQEGESIMKPGNKGMMHHEELLFIVTHQSIELWFKVLIKDLEKARELLKGCHPKCPTTPEGSPSDYQNSWKNLAVVGHYLKRAAMIFHQAADSFTVLQTMHPADFLEFRDYLVPASGFQSFQFRQIEILLGLNEQERVTCNDEHVFNALRNAQRVECLKLVAQSDSLRAAIEELLLAVNVPEDFMDSFFECTEELHVLRQAGPAHHSDEHARRIAKEKTDEIRDIIAAPNDNIPANHPSQKRDSKVIKAALYVSAYRAEHPQFAVMSQTLDELIAVEEGLLLFRSRHLYNVERVIGRRVGTGGSSGVGYLEKTREYRIFTTLWALRKVFIRSSILPPFSKFHESPSTVNMFYKDEEQEENLSEPFPLLRKQHDVETESQQNPAVRG